MQVCSLFLLAVLAVFAANYGCDAEMAKPAMTDGRLTGQLTVDEVEYLSRSKRQTRNRNRNRPNRPRRPQRPAITTTTTTDTPTPSSTIAPTQPPPTTKEVTQPPQTTAKATTQPPPTTAEATQPPPTTAEATQPPQTTAKAITQPPPTTAEATQPPPTTAEATQPPPTTAEATQPPPTTAEATTQPPPTTSEATTQPPLPTTTTTSPPPPATAGATTKSEEESTHSPETVRNIEDTTQAPVEVGQCGTQTYRTASGQCNHETNQFWGSTDQPFLRLMTPEYTLVNNGHTIVQAPRRYSDVDGGELPNVRLISRVIHDPDDRPSQRTIMVMQWGQFLDHDITATPINPDNKTCCSTDLILNDAQHEDVNINGPCFPIIIPDGDNHFIDLETRCMENKRSFQTFSSDGVPEQINILSAFVDGSQVYGSSEEEMESLRSDEKGRGRLLDKDDNLPEGSTESCVIATGREGLDYCLLAGDRRVNVYPGLGALHTVFMRMHNVIADGLADVHPEWDDDTVFQEARRINVALLQKITYSDWLNVIVGDDAMEEYGLDSGNYEYDESFDPTLYNVFSAAAFRFGHSMITDGLVINDVFYESISLFLNPHHVLHSLDSLVEGLVEDVGQRVDRWYSTGMTNHMFETSEFNGFDIVSLNIQRGRDHGLAPYYKWRSFCDPDETVLSSFDDLGNSGRRFSNVYRHVEDVDLYSGALNEAPVTRGSVGKTYACLIGLQFEGLKYGDRYWYENKNSPHPFNDDQIREIERQSLATVLCQTTGIQSIQRNVFNPPSDNNVVSDCSAMRTINFNLF